MRIAPRQCGKFGKHQLLLQNVGIAQFLDRSETGTIGAICKKSAKVRQRRSDPPLDPPRALANGFLRSPLCKSQKCCRTRLTIFVRLGRRTKPHHTTKGENTSRGTTLIKVHPLDTDGIVRLKQASICVRETVVIIIIVTARRDM